jgi:hypothetical protein
MYIVYCPAAGYSLTNDTGKRFRLASEAEHFVLALRRSGLYAWTENL